MLHINPITFGIALFLLGLVLFIVVLLTMRALRNQPPRTLVSPNSQVVEEKSRSQELAELAQLAQVINSPREQKDFIALLVESIKPLLDVEIFGFLM